MTMQEADFVVIGAGSAGCLLANRLSADPDNQVVLLEAGGKDTDLLIRVPLLAAINYFRASLNWGYETEPQAALGGKRVVLPRGKVLGGTSSINGMMYMRGHRRDYDGWAASGLDGWSYDEVLPHFKAFEHNFSHPEDDAHHGRDGELPVVEARGENPLYERWIAAGVVAGFRRNLDFNGAEQEGVGFHDFNIRNGRRVSSAGAFLHPIADRKNLAVITRAQATRLCFEGKRCVAVEYRQGGTIRKVKVRREAVLSAGVFNSPQLLQLSGIGGGELLRRHGIEMVADSPDVGRNFEDHCGLFVEYKCLQPVSLYSLFRPDRIATALLQAFFFGTGPASRIPLEAGGLLKTNPDLDAPDIQLTFVPGLSLATTRAGQREHGFLTSICILRPKSRGWVEIRSANPLDKPIIQPNYFSAPEDVATIREGAKLVRRIVAQSPLDPYRGAEITPGAAVQSDAELDAWVLRSVSTLWHGSSTCRMGTDAGAVVDKHLKVRGVEGVRVADTSIMPNIIGGNTSIPAMMIAEKCAAMMLGNRR
jgi:choline dehydrogenase